MINIKTFGAFFFVGVNLAAYGCSSSDTPAAAPVPDAGGKAEDDGGACKATQVPTDYEKCFSFASTALPAAKPVTTQCLPSELEGERPKGAGFEEFSFGDWILTDAYDLSSDCANAKTLVENLRYNDLYINVASEYTARADGALGKTAAQYVRLPPPPADPDAAAPDGGDSGDAGAPQPQLLTVPDRTCPPKAPEVSCIALETWFQGGFFTGTATELRVFKNASGANGGAPDPTTAKLYAVYKKAQ